MSDYKITKKDVDGMVNYLRYFHPDKANESDAREFLEYWKSMSHRLALTNFDALNELYYDFQKSKKSSAR